MVKIDHCSEWKRISYVTLSLLLSVYLWFVERYHVEIAGTVIGQRGGLVFSPKCLMLVEIVDRKDNIKQGSMVFCSNTHAAHCDFHTFYRSE